MEFRLLQFSEKIHLKIKNRTFHCDLDDPNDVARVKGLWLEANETCANMGAVLSNPYGQRADIIYRRVDPTYVKIIKDWKRALDPNNIPSPGQLCF